MTIETVKATYDRDTKTIRVKLSDKPIDRTHTWGQSILVSRSNDNEIVGIEVILS